jgi:hypothetical protein
MGFDLTNDSGKHYRLNNRGWSVVLGLARAYGWRPRGTLVPEGYGEDGEEETEPWDPEDYGTNNGQRVMAEDAAALADALQACLSDPDAPTKLAEVTAEQRQQAEQLFSAMNETGFADELQRQVREAPFPALAGWGIKPPPRAKPKKLDPAKLASQMVGSPSFEELRSTIKSFIAFCRKGGFRIG